MNNLKQDNSNSILKSFGVGTDSQDDKFEDEFFKSRTAGAKDKKKRKSLDKEHFSALLKRRRKDPENEDYHDHVREYLNEIKEGAGDSFSEEFDPVEHSVAQGHRIAKEHLSNED